MKLMYPTMKTWKVSWPWYFTTAKIKRWSGCNRHWSKKNSASRTAQLVHPCMFVIISDCKRRGYESSCTISLCFRIFTTAFPFWLPFDVDFYTIKTGKLKRIWDLVKTSRQRDCNSSKYFRPAFAICDPADIFLAWYQQSWTASCFSREQSFIGLEQYWQNLEILK